MTDEPRRTAAHRAAEGRAWGWFRLAQVPQFAQRHPWLERAALVAFAVCISGQLWTIQTGVRESARAQPCPVSYPGPWQTDRRAYHPGDIVRFRYLRRNGEGNLILFQVDNWERQGTGELYAGALLGRHVGAVGLEEVRQVRELPQKMQPNTYRLRGWISAQTSRRTLPTEYVSEPFEVRAGP